ncbi:MAG: UPF0301 protein YqgE [uncultured Thiotrichaceae bacterium]|uniref:UPF0301 protein HELGO_WM6380 n=1 Tax=uncultured Thiotrichaceae bacterium TaxID=298394 RepID=A0A6S6TI11_9GAMM|nr:MAG: UPF0301 protein YqgE [uncultured Thiotrichaceae bacterium]
MPATNLQLQNQLLIAMPGMRDSRFSKSVSVIARHTNDGCLGLVINQRTQTSLADLFEHLNIESDDEFFETVQVFNGGPVQPEQGFVLHNTDQEWESTLNITSDLSVTTSRDILDDIARHEGPEKYMVCLGCASWEAGQIERELLENTWLTCKTDAALIFDAPLETRWHAASQLLGIDVRLMSGTSGHA